MAVIEEYDTSRRFFGTVRENHRLTPAEHAEDVRRLLVDVDQRGIDFSSYETVGVLAHGPEDMGRPLFLRLYAIAGFEPVGDAGEPTIELCIRRCFYVDEYSGELYPGTVSNYLCDREIGDTLDLTGPFGDAFRLPEDREADVIMIGMGTGIAPFRTLVKRMYESKGEWGGKVRLFHGARTGLDLAYINDESRDLGLYMHRDTFRAIRALSPRPHFNEPPAFDAALQANAEEVWSILNSKSGCVYVAGLRQIGEQLDKAFTDMAGSHEAWLARKEAMVDAGRWNELLY